MIEEPNNEVPETLATYLRLRGLKAPPSMRRKKRQRTTDDENAPFTPGRDPHGIGEALAALTKQHGWDSQLAQEDLLLRWIDIAGPETAGHTEPVSLVDGLLTIRCDSTAWTKQLQFMRTQIMTQIAVRHPEARVENIRFVGPDVPSWKWGPRTAPGRGPRDTYG